jgi:hypothetical protein
LDVGGAFGSFASAIETMFGLSRTARLRRAIEANVNLYKAMQEHDELMPASKHMSLLIERQAEGLLSDGDGSVRKQRNPSSFFVGMVFTALVALPESWLIRHLDHWWWWLLMVVDGLVIALFVYASIAAGLNPPGKRKT